MPHDRFFGMAAEELSNGRFDRDLFARCYSKASGNSEKAKAIYIAVRADRIEAYAKDIIKEAARSIKEEHKALKKEIARAEREARELRREQEARLEREAKQRSISEQAAISAREEDAIRMIIERNSGSMSGEHKTKLSQKYISGECPIQDSIAAMRDALRASGWPGGSA